MLEQRQELGTGLPLELGLKIPEMAPQARSQSRMMDSMTSSDSAGWQRRLDC